MLNTSDFIFIFFFFQAEDGIRDWSVNGVQTCALPISLPAQGRRALAVHCAGPEESSHPGGSRTTRAPLCPLAVRYTGKLMEPAAIVFPIRFATGNIAVQTTTSALSEQGVLVRCLEPPSAGTAVSIKLYLPGAREAMLLDGRVHEHPNPGDEPGFWADFVGVADAQRAQIGEVIARRRRSADAKPIGAG